MIKQLFKVQTSVYTKNLFNGCEWNSSLIQPEAETISRGLDFEGRE